MNVLARRVDSNATDIQREVALRASQTVISATPVDTGRARNNWVIGLGNPSRQIQNEGAEAEAISRNEGRINRAKNDQDIYISNNLPYIQFLNEGSSAQAPANFVEQAVQTAANATRGRKLLR